MTELLELITTNSNQIGVIAGIAGVIGMLIGFISVIVAIRSHRLSKRIATASKSLEQADIQVRLFDEEETESFIAVLPITKGRILEFPLPIYIANKGKKTANDIEIYLRLNKDLAYGGYSDWNVEGPDIGVKFTHMLMGNFITFMWQIPMLNPNRVNNFNIPLSIRNETSFLEKVKINHEDSTEKTFLVEIEYAFELHVMVSFRDHQPYGRRFTLKIINCVDDEVTSVLNKHNELIKSEYKKHPPKYKLKRLFNPMDRFGLHRIVVVYVKDDKVNKDDRSPIDRINERQLIWCQGVQDVRGMFIPAIGIN